MWDEKSVAAVKRKNKFAYKSVWISSIRNHDVPAQTLINVLIRYRKFNRENQLRILFKKLRLVTHQIDVYIGTRTNIKTIVWKETNWWTKYELYLYVFSRIIWMCRTLRCNTRYIENHFPSWNFQSNNAMHMLMKRKKKYRSRCRLLTNVPKRCYGIWVSSLSYYRYQLGILRLSSSLSLYQLSNITI